jgi:ATP-dependent helicase/nuclease subunit A
MIEFPEIPAETRNAQMTASDPSRSAWVSANAGSGKTFVLAQRVIRLLLDGVEPSRILCLTFTRAAAAEMSNRVFETLSKWVTMNAPDLDRVLEKILGRPATHDERGRARILFALALDTPGGLKIQTIHAFCEALLHQFALEANMSGYFRVMEDEMQQMLVQDAKQAVLRELESGAVQRDPARQELYNAFMKLLKSVSDDAIERGLNALLMNRHAFMEWLDGDVDKALAPFWYMHGLVPDQQAESIFRSALANSEIANGIFDEIGEAARFEGGKNNLAFFNRLETIHRASTPETIFRALEDFFMSGSGKARSRRKQTITKAVSAQWPDFFEMFDREFACFIALKQQYDALRILEQSRALFLLAQQVLLHYNRTKKARGLTDFDDLIEAAANLLTRANIRHWIQYKLDSGIDHVLVDEAQDTSPRQWQIINAVIEEFYAGEGASKANRTAFAVGDEKQSIFSFQGADPGEFSRQATFMEKKAKSASHAFCRISLNLSFRTVPDLLEAVDRVFAIPENFKGLSRLESNTVHEAIRRSDTGEVWIWPLYAQERREQPDSWLAPVDALETGDPAIRLAQRIASTIRHWLKTGEKLAGRDKPIRCGDILILVRRRDKFSKAIIRELKLAGLAIAGADRLVLSDHIAIEDLIALGRFVLMQEDDLSLAGILKSPLFGFSEDDLLSIAGQRGKISLFSAMKQMAGEPSSHLQQRIAAAVKRLDYLCSIARRWRAYEFFAYVLGRDGGRKAFLARLGMEAEDVLDAFLQAAIDHEASGGRDLEDFICAFSQSPPEIKREVDMKKDEIRVITVHAAKGLEAPIVFVVDPCSPAFNPQHRPKIIEVESAEGHRGFVWQSSSDLAVPMTENRLEELREEAEDEYHRLLYVAMTRAADRLIICGWHGLTAPQHRHWHRMVSEALASDAIENFDDTFGESLIWRSPGRSMRPERQPGDSVEAAMTENDYPPGQHDWLFRNAPRERLPHDTLSPSLAWGRFSGDDTSTSNFEAAPDSVSVRQEALDRGLVVHRLLQILPDIAVDQRAEFAGKWMQQNMAQWDDQFRTETFSQIKAVLENPELADLFGHNSRAEVNLAGKITLKGLDMPVSGQIDRLSVSPEKIVLADFKTNQDVPGDPSEIPPGYILQLALYRELLREIYNDRRICCMLVWTQNGAATILDDAMMDMILNRAGPSM